ncbi:MAG: tRNA lysidine(34) synthetase TilS [Lachnospiraceae bacterium]|nr:tRNA lysidine(34) synthetase TilS [Lachnospiraceae bacterium]
MKHHIFTVIKNYHMIEPGERVIVGVSGGADSVCLLRLLCEYRREVSFEIQAVHVEHGLRGQESLEDAGFVEDLCEKWRVACRVEQVDVPALSRSEGLSCEEAGRLARYRIFEEAAKEWGARRIAVAHNQNDQAETVLWNLARGSGPKGLGGIRPVQGKLIRPLLFSSRREIEEYLRAEGLSWRTDRTNLEPDFTRNRIRLTLLPWMEQNLNGQSVRHIAQAADRLQEVSSYLKKKTDEAAGRCIVLSEMGEESGVLHFREASPGTDFPRETAVRDGYGTSVCILLDFYKKEEPLIQKELLKRAVQLCIESAQKEDCCNADDVSLIQNARHTGEQAVKNTCPGEKEKTGNACFICSGEMKNFGAVHFDMLLRLADMDCGKSADLPGGIYAVRENGILRIARREPAVPAQTRGENMPTQTRGESVPLQACGENIPAQTHGDMPAQTSGESVPLQVCDENIPAQTCGRIESVPMQACGKSVPTQTRGENVSPPGMDDTGYKGFPLTADGMLLPVPGSIAFGEYCVTAELTENAPELKTKILKENKCTKWFSYDTISNSLRVRTRKPGDYLVVDARGGTKKLKDYFIDQKIPRSVRDRIPLLADGSHILWVIGWRMSEAAKVREDTRRILKCTFLEP